MSSSPIYCPCGQSLHTKHCLASLFKCTARAVVRLAAQGRWPSTRLAVKGAKNAGEYRFTDAMIAQIISDGERWPETAANEPKRQAPKAAKQQPAQRRTRQPQPAPIPGSNVRPLVAKGPRRVGRAS